MPSNSPTTGWRPGSVRRVRNSGLHRRSGDCTEVHLRRFGSDHLQPADLRDRAGHARDLDPATLATLCSGTGGSLLLTGDDEGDTFFLLAKYFLQILAGATNAEIVLDPEGYLAPDAGTVRIDFA